MRILVVGAGATGGYIGGRLMQAGQDVTFLVRPGRARHLQERGLRIVGLGENTILIPKLIISGEVAETFDLVILAVKATALHQAIEDLAPAVGPDTLILPLLNGLGHIDALVKRFGARSVLGCAVKVVTTVDTDGDVVRLADLHSLTYGTLGPDDSRSLSDVHNVLSDIGFDTSESEDIVGVMWAKWVFIASTGAVNCLMRGTIGEVAAVPGGTAFAEAVVSECAAIAAAAGHPVPRHELHNTRTTVTTPGSPFASSLYRDLVQGNSIEGNHIFGDLVSRARDLDVPVPLLDLVTAHLEVHQNRVEAQRAG